MIQNPPRQYPFDVRPMHRETAESYTTRLLAANFETPAHLAQLVRERTDSQRKADRACAEREVIVAKTKRSLLHLDRHPSGWLTHADGTSCVCCADKLPERWMCALCSHGASVKQNPHFDSLVCVKHQRWIGLTSAPSDQKRVGEAHLEAARYFASLRRRHLIDVRLYLLVSDLLQLSSGREAEPSGEYVSFPRVIALIWALTREEFARQFFNPVHRFVDAHALLTSTIHDVLGEANHHVVRALWLYLRPTAAALRRSILDELPFKPGWPHDFPLAEHIARNFNARPHQLEPFRNYLAVTGDTVRSANRYIGAQRNERTLPAETVGGKTRRRALAICENGHRTEVKAIRHSTDVRIACATCAGHSVQRGENDLATTHPSAARQFDPDMNGGVTSRNIVASSKRVYYWRCHRGHSFEATVASRTYRGTSCPVCCDRIVVPGVNDIQTTHPQIAETWHPSWRDSWPPSTIAASSPQSILWRCKNDHSYFMRVSDRVAGKTCSDCIRETAEGEDANLLATHPELAAEWHPERNGRLTPDTYTSGSRDKVAWLCHLGHTFFQRIDLRAKGYGCGRCAKQQRNA